MSSSEHGQRSESFQGTLTLHTYFRSSCSARVRTACNLKGIALKFSFVNLLKAEHKTEQYLADMNPGGLVPTLAVDDSISGVNYTITQSIAILEWIEESFPDRRPLLPPLSNPLERAHVRELVNIIANDIQPPTNMRILQRVNKLGVTSREWCAEYMHLPLLAYDRLVEQYGGKFSFGDNITLADVCLAPAMENAIRWEVDTSKYPHVMRVYNQVKDLEDFLHADWRHQKDTPEMLKG